VYNSSQLKVIKNNSNFDTRNLKRKLHLIVYADPDQKSNLSSVLDTIKNQKFPRSKVGLVFIVNFKATWIPDGILNSKLKSKQKENKDFIFVKDLNRVIQYKWHLKDNAVNLILLNKNQRILFTKKGDIKNSDINRLIKLIRKKM